MNAIDLLMQDHRKVEKLFSELQTGTSDSRERLVRELEQELRTHTDAEEQAFYSKLHAESGEMISRSVEEHAQARRSLAQLVKTDVDSERFEANLMQLMKEVQTHIREEEEPGGVMNAARDQLTESALDGIGEDIERIKEELRGQKVA
jgi:hemerythrin superfamily protein